MLSWTYFGVNTSIEGTGGQSCVNYITTKRRLLESACVCIIFMYTLHRSYFKLNFDNPRHPIVQTKFRQILLLLHTFVFGIEIGFKLATSTLIWVLNPCHILTILQILLLASSRPSLRTVIFRIHVHMMNGPLLALTFPVLNTRFLPFERVTYFVQHFLIILIPTTFLNQNSEFSVEPIDDFSWVTFSLSIQVLYHFLILQPIALITGINLNNILCPAISDPFPGPNYRLWAVFHQSATVLLLGKIFTLFLLRLNTKKLPWSYLNSNKCDQKSVIGRVLESRSSNISSSKMVSSWYWLDLFRCHAYLENDARDDEAVNKSDNRDFYKPSPLDQSSL
uniref:Budding uninhibited by benzimidazoles 3 homolog n=1 Tax=Schistosoma japonicum TaxID=6182 RepID=C1LEI8_SCHJA|nr:budding uninhibited by benzimidazoles 3 homolog [Schistosoma japonicum]